VNGEEDADSIEIDDDDSMSSRRIFIKAEFMGKREAR
jgi:hypothetical protein